MTQRQLAVLALRLMGIWILGRWVAYLAYPLGQLWQGISFEFTLSDALVAAETILPAVVGLLLILRASRLSRWVVPEGSHASLAAPLAIDSRTLQGIAFSCIGVLLFAHGLQFLSVYIVLATAPSDSQSMLKYMNDTLLSQLIGPATQFVLGLGLFFGGNTLARFWHKLRDAGSPPAAEQDPSHDPTHNKDA